MHVRIPSSLHQSFPWLHPDHAKFTIFRVPSCVLRRRPSWYSAGRCCTLAGWHLSLSMRTGVFHPNTRIHVRLLGPCFKTGQMTPFRQYPYRAAGLRFADCLSGRRASSSSTHTPPGPRTSAPRRTIVSSVPADVCNWCL